MVPRPYTHDHGYPIWQKILYITAQALCIILTNLLNFGIIWYENNVSDNRRTLINKMVAITSLYIMLFISLGSGLTQIQIFAFGAQSLLMCQLALTSTFFFFTLLALGFVETTLIRHLYSHHFSVVGVMNEAFLRRFLLALNFVISLAVSFILHSIYAVERSHMFCYCTHISTQTFCPSESSVKPIFRMTLISLTICMLCTLTVMIRTRKHPHVPSSSNQILSHSLGTVKTSFFGTALVLLLSFCPGFFVFGAFSNYFKESSSWSEKKRHDMMAISGLNFNILVGVFIPAIFYIRSQHLRETIWRSVQELFMYRQNTVVQLNGP